METKETKETTEEEKIISDSTAETVQKVLSGAFSGAATGAPIGAVGAVVTGAAVIVAAPVWVPVVGGVAAISTATVITWGAIGAIAGAISGGAINLYQKMKTDENFKNHFGKDNKSEKGETPKEKGYP